MGAFGFRAPVEYFGFCEFWLQTPEPNLKNLNPKAVSTILKVGLFIPVKMNPLKPIRP